MIARGEVVEATGASAATALRHPVAVFFEIVKMSDHAGRARRDQFGRAADRPRERSRRNRRASLMPALAGEAVR